MEKMGKIHICTSESENREVTIKYLRCHFPHHPEPLEPSFCIQLRLICETSKSGLSNQAPGLLHIPLHIPTECFANCSCSTQLPHIINMFTIGGEKLHVTSKASGPLFFAVPHMTMTGGTEKPPNTTHCFFTTVTFFFFFGLLRETLDSTPKSVFQPQAAIVHTAPGAVEKGA